MAEDQSGTPEEILNSILAALQGEDESRILQAIGQLKSISYSSDSIRRKLEKLAATHVNDSIRQSALEALNLQTNRYVRSRTNRLQYNERSIVLKEIQEWENSKLIDEKTGQVLRRRYDFDMAGSTETASLVESTSPVEKEAPAVKQDSAGEVESTGEGKTSAQPSFTQTLLSETSIKVFLYLGAFFVIAAAIILAALDIARLPILLTTTALFGAGSLAIKKRLPQPSFTLFVVFSFLMPIDLRVIADQLKFTGNILDMYWAITLMLMAVIWAFGTIFYESRFFSLAALLAFELGTLNLFNAVSEEAEPVLLGMVASTCAALGWIYFLKHWKDEKFGAPAFITIQLVMLILAPIELGVNVARIYSDSPSYFSTGIYWALALCTWIGVSAFYMFSEELYPFILFEWPVSLALVYLPWFGLRIFNITQWVPNIYALVIWGLIYAIASEWTRVSTRERVSKYHYAVLNSMLIPFATAWAASVIGWYSEDISTLLHVIIVSLFAALVLLILNIRKIRVVLWIVALLFLQSAYYFFFQLPSIEKLNIFIGFQYLGAVLVLFLPDLFLVKDFKAAPAWRVPLRVFGGLNLLLSLPILFDQLYALNGKAAIIFGVYTLFFLIYAILYNAPLLGYLPTILASFATLFLLHYLHSDSWLWAFSGLGLLYYVIGILLLKKESWSNTFCFSALGLGTILAFSALINAEKFGGWPTLVFGILFILEMFLRKQGWPELGAQVLLPLALYMILDNFNVQKFDYYALAIAVLWLFSDAFLYKTFSPPRMFAWVSRALGGLLILINVVDLLFTGVNQPLVALICFGVYTIFFILYALLYARPVLGYGVTLFLAFTVVYTMRYIKFNEWFLPITALGVLYYLLGLFRRRDEGIPLITWSFVLWTSGVILGLTASILAPVKGGLSSAIPSAVTATLVAVEAFKRRSAWLALPANALYVFSYFVLLTQLKVDEPQFFSVGAALLGMFQHYLLTRARSKSGAFIMGLLSQLTLLGTTYIQMVNTEKLGYFMVLFLQSIVVILYGLFIRSRSLVFVPIGIVVIGVITVFYSQLKGLSTVFLIGCAGILFIFVGIGAVLLRERISKIGEQFTDWQA